jgi:predicted nucleotidyltransferase component of viral defense system
MITQGYLARHFQGRSGMRDPALLDVAQDYALKYLHDQGAFELGIILKGGTSLRKLRAGNAGRFSTDLDFVTPDLETAELLLDTLDGAELFDIRFSLDEREATRAKLIVTYASPGVYTITQDVSLLAGQCETESGSNQFTLVGPTATTSTAVASSTDTSHQNLDLG